MPRQSHAQLAMIEAQGVGLCHDAEADNLWIDDERQTLVPSNEPAFVSDDLNRSGVAGGQLELGSGPFYLNDPADRRRGPYPLD